MTMANKLKLMEAEIKGLKRKQNEQEEGLLYARFETQWIKLDCSISNYQSPIHQFLMLSKLTNPAMLQLHKKEMDLYAQIVLLGKDAQQNLCVIYEDMKSKIQQGLQVNAASLEGPFRNFLHHTQVLYMSAQGLGTPQYLLPQQTLQGQVRFGYNGQANLGGAIIPPSNPIQQSHPAIPSSKMAVVTAVNVGLVY